MSKPVFFAAGVQTELDEAIARVERDSLAFPAPMAFSRTS